MEGNTGMTLLATGHKSGGRERRLRLAAFCASLACSVSLYAHTQAVAQELRQFSIPAGSLDVALTRFGAASGIQIFYDASLTRGLKTSGAAGSLPPREALGKLLDGTGLSFRFTAPDRVTVSNASQAPEATSADGSLVLETITVTGKTGRYGSPDAPYGNDAPTAFISGEDIERFRGSSPADMFRGTAGVMSGEARNGAGAIDVNIRGMQGMGRVATTVDGAENSVTVYQGYQGVSNRTYVDPDFIAGVDITKGADAASFGNAGSVAMRTVGADDIVKPGEKWGLKVKGGFGTNSSSPTEGALSGYSYQSGAGTATPSADGMDRPAFLKPTTGSGSVIGAYKGEDIDVVAGYAHRRQGNYHAGSHGPVASPKNIGDTKYWGGTLPNTMINEGLANYRGGEEVLNTELETQSLLAKVTARLSDDQTFQIGYMGYRSEAGDRLASRLTSNTGQAQQQEQTVSTSLDTFTARYNWNPEDNDLIDFKSNFYFNHLEVRNSVRGGRGLTPEKIGLPSGFRVGTDTNMWGAEITNRSQFSLDYGDFDLNYGFSYRAEDTKGSDHTAVLEGWLTPRDAIRHEGAAFAKAAYKPVDWLTLNGGLRYSHYWVEDRFDPYERYQARDKPVGLKVDDGGFSPSAGVTLEPFDNTQFYVNYSNTLRSPSIIESVSAFNSVIANAGVLPERSSNWEIGTNIIRDGIFSEDDTAMIKFGYFNWDVKNYISRTVVTEPQLTLNIGNIPRAKFSGLELSGRYTKGGFSADLSANYFLNVEYCRTTQTCDSKSLYGDYATNHVQPEYTVDLTLSQKFLEDRLTVGGRVSYVGPRAIGHGDVTAQGASQFIALVDWEPYTLVDLFTEYKINDNMTASLRVENLFDRFYVDPLGLVTQPGPGRTIYASLTATIGGGEALPGLSPFNSPTDASFVRDWTGFHVGAHAGGDFLNFAGNTTSLDGTFNDAAARESADFNLRGGAFGLQAGYDRQLENGFVVGVEADYTKTYLRGLEKFGSTDPVLAKSGYLDATTSYDIDWTAGLRAKLGYAVNDRLLVYSTAGLALAKETQWRDQYISDGASATNPLGSETTAFFVEKASGTRAGFTIGLGAEYALNDNWSIRADYSYSHFRAKSFKFKNARAGTGKDYRTSEQTGTEMVDPGLKGDPNMAWLCDAMPEVCEPYESPIYEYVDHVGTSGITNGRNASNSLNLHAIKVGLNYRF